MTDDDIMRTVAEIIATVLQRPVGPTDDVVRADEPQWDSLKHIEIVFALEDAFNMRFTEADMARLTSASAIAALVRSKRAS